MSDKGPILILTASTGAGHAVAAGALAEAFVGCKPRADVEVHDLLDSTNAFFRTLYADGYLALVNYLPGAMGALYEQMDGPDRHHRHALRAAFQNLNAHGAVRYLKRLRPRLIVNTHFLPAELVAQMRARGRLDCPQVTVITDFETHRMWAQHPTERYYTATEQGKAFLTTWNVDPQQILVTGIPVRPAFEHPAQRAPMRRRRGLDTARPVILLLSGGFGVGPTERLLRELTSVRQDAQIVVITGRNEKLRQRLQRVADSSARSVRVVGYTDRMHEWMRAADVLITKPGGLTAAEALVCGLPLVIVNPIPGAETRNSDYLLENGAAIKVNNPRLLGYRVGELLDNPARLRALRRAARALARPGAASRIAADALRLIETGDN